MDSQQPTSPHTLLVDAVILAETRAGVTGLLQVVCRVGKQGEWWYARADAPLVIQVEVFLTVVPSSYLR